MAIIQIQMYHRRIYGLYLFVGMMILSFVYYVVLRFSILGSICSWRKLELIGVILWRYELWNRLDLESVKIGNYLSIVCNRMLLHLQILCHVSPHPMHFLFFLNVHCHSLFSCGFEPCWTFWRPSPSSTPLFSDQRGLLNLH